MQFAAGKSASRKAASPASPFSVSVPIVKRCGSEVTVRDAKSIPALRTASSHDKFMLLLNLKEYEEGIA